MPLYYNDHYEVRTLVGHHLAQAHAERPQLPAGSNRCHYPRSTAFLWPSIGLCVRGSRHLPRGASWQPALSHHRWLQRRHARLLPLPPDSQLHHPIASRPCRSCSHATQPIMSGATSGTSSPTKKTDGLASHGVLPACASLSSPTTLPSHHSAIPTPSHSFRPHPTALPLRIHAIPSHPFLSNACHPSQPHTPPRRRAGRVHASRLSAYAVCIRCGAHCPRQEAPSPLRARCCGPAPKPSSMAHSSQLAARPPHA